MKPPLFRLLCAALFLFSLHHTKANDAWLQPFPAHRIAGNLYYVGSRDLASYLVATPEGHILINSSLQESVPLIKKSVEELGFQFTDIRILLISHAHSDHCAGSAQVLEKTGAQYCVMKGDAESVEKGGLSKARAGRPAYMQFPPVRVDRRLEDGDEVVLGGSTLVAHLTPGHTRGCTTWTMKVKQGDTHLNAVIIGSPNVNAGYVLVNNPDYPEIATDYVRTFKTLKSLPVDFFLGAHGAYYRMEGKYAAPAAADKNPFIDPAGYAAYVSERETAFLAELERQKSGVR